MLKKIRLQFLLLWLFLAGVVLIVFIQFTSGENIKKLIEGNRTLLQEVEVQNNLRSLEADLLTAESELRAYAASGDSSQFAPVLKRLSLLESRLTKSWPQLVNKNFYGDSSLLAHMVRRKVQFMYNTLAATHKGDASAAINWQQGSMFRDSIVQLFDRAERLRRQQLQQVSAAVERNGHRARVWGIVLAALASVACALAFLYLSNREWQQEKMIAALNESEKKVKESAVVKEQFLANMSHEIRTPMNAVLGFAHLLRSTALAPKQKEYVECISSSGENLMALLNDILDLSKMEAGMLRIEAEPFSLRSLVSSVETVFRQKADQKGLAFSINVAEDLPDAFTGDAVRLTQVLINLLSNAVKFTEAGGVTLHVQSKQKNNDDIQWLQFVVTDTGVGIPANKLESIFDRFQQAEAQTTRRFGGTGLGLSIVKQIVDILGGSIQVDSKVGQGSTFLLSLPFHPAKPEHKQNSDLKLAQPSLSPLRALVAEDNPMNQKLVRHLLSGWDVDVQLVGTGRQAVEALMEQDFDVVLMDIQMPEMDGLSATIHIRTQLNKQVPVIAMTAHAMAGEKEKCLAAGMSDYISKPIREQELYQKLAPHKKEPMHVSERVVDTSYLKQLSNGDDAFEQAIMEQFLEQAPEELRQLKDAIATENFDAVKTVSHGLKSTVAYMGLAEALHPILHQLETINSSTASMTQMQALWQFVADTCTKAYSEVELLLQQKNIVEEHGG